ncbi:Zinc finger protein 208-like, partial [Homarus americanus]
MNKHKRLHSDSRPYICDKCGNSFRQKHSLKDHIKKHETDVNRYTCKYCFLKFLGKQKWMTHENKHKGSYACICEVCGMGYENKKALEDHRSKHTGQYRHYCKECGKGFNRIETLNDHLNAFLKRNHLCRHMRLHTGEKPYEETAHLEINVEGRNEGGIKEDHLMRGEGKRPIKFKYSHLDYQVIKPKRRTRARNLDTQVYLDEPLSCSECGDLFNNEPLYKIHCAEAHVEINGVKCPYCPLVFDKRYDLDSHLINHTPTNHACDNCAVGFPTATLLIKHLQDIHPDTANTCLRCNATFIDEKQLQFHFEQKHRKGKRKMLNIDKGDIPPNNVMCKECGKLCKNMIAYQTHKYNEHIHLFPHECKVCCRRFTKLTYLESHMKTHIDGSFECMRCGVKFGTESHLIDHMYYVHGQKKVLMCDECNRYFSTPTSLKTHKEMEHRANLDCNEICKVCEERYPTKLGLKRHMFTHIRAYQCSHCLRKLSSKASLDIHINMVHTKEHSFLCSHCSKEFYAKHLLQMHIKRVHSDRSDYQFKCKLCGKVYLQEWELTLHHKTHTNERNFKCDVCGDAFYTLSRMRYHRATHKTTRDSECPLCTQMFRRDVDTKNHLRRVHKVVHPGQFMDFCSRFGLEKARKLLQMGVISSQDSRVVTEKIENVMDEDGSENITLYPVEEEHEPPVQVIIPDSVEMMVLEDPAMDISATSDTQEEKVAYVYKMKKETIKHEEQIISIIKELDVGDNFAETEDNRDEVAEEGRLGRSRTVKTKTCIYCEEEVPITQLMSHLSGHEQQQYPCPFCQHISPRLAMSRHLQEHHLEYFLSCDGKVQIDGFVWSSQGSLVCRICEKRFKKASVYLAHEKTHSSKRFSCQHCRSSYPTDASFQNHIITHQFGDYQCAECFVKFASLHQLNIHDEKVHKIKLSKICEYCNKEFRDQMNLICHRRKEHPESEECRKAKYSCSECGMKFMVRGNLVRHLRMHDKEKVSKPSVCALCGKVLSNKYSLATHLKTHSHDTSHECKICDKAFVSKYTLVDHMRRIHEDIGYGRDKICKQCGRSFFTNSELKYHMKTHTGERPYRCEICGETYLSSSTLRYHMQKHSNVMFVCPECQAQFKNYVGWSAHMRRVHGVPCVKEYTKKYGILQAVIEKESPSLYIVTQGHNRSVDAAVEAAENISTKEILRKDSLNSATLAAGLEETVVSMPGKEVNNIIHVVSYDDLTNPLVHTVDAAEVGLGNSKVEEANISQSSAGVGTNSMNSGTESSYPQSGDVRRVMIPEGWEMILPTGSEESQVMSEEWEGSRINVPQTNEDQHMVLTNEWDGTQGMAQLVISEEGEETRVVMTSWKDCEIVDVVTIGLAANTPAREWPEGESGNAITVFYPTEGSRLRRRRPASYRPCDICGIIPFGDVERHVAEYHPETLIRPCVLCDSRFRTFRQLGSHVLRIHGPSLVCPVCSSAFLDAFAFSKHLHDAHSEIPAAFTCVVCRHSLSSSMDYCSHMETHQAEAALLSAEDQADKAEIRDSAHNTIGALDEEERSQLWCSQCQKKLKSAVALKRHLQRVHRVRPSFQCEVCFLRFQSSGRLSEHVKRHHLREHYARFVCRICNKAYLTRHELLRHTAAHQNERRHKCEFCSRAYFKAGDLTYHRRTHTGERPHGCNSCEAAFSRPSELTTHLARAHGLHHRTRRYFRTAAPDPPESTNVSSEVISRRSIDQNVDVEVVTGEGDNASQLITEVEEDGRVVHVVESDASLQVMHALSHDLAKDHSHELQHDQGIRFRRSALDIKYADVEGNEEMTLLESKDQLQEETTEEDISQLLETSPQLKYFLSPKEITLQQHKEEHVTDCLKQYASLLKERGLAETPAPDPQPPLKRGRPRKMSDCTNCDLVYDSPADLDRHIRREPHEVNDIDAASRCQQCGELIPQDEMEEHLHEHLLAKEPIPIKMQVTSNQQYKKVKKRLGRPVKRKSHRCPDCNLVFPSPAGLSRHNHTQHPQKYSRQCEECGHRFKGRRALELHKDGHKNGSCWCPICKLKFRHRQHVECHFIKAHADVTNINCEYCSIQVTSYNVHMNLHTRAVQFPCKECGEVFFLRSSLLAHHKLRHDQNARAYVCKNCKKGFISSSLLRTHHEQVHLQKRQYFCEFCGRSYKNKSALTYHLKVHTGERPYKCQECGVGFHRPSTLKTHMEGTHHLPYSYLYRKPQRRAGAGLGISKVSGPAENTDHANKGTSNIVKIDVPRSVIIENEVGIDEVNIVREMSIVEGVEEVGDVASVSVNMNESEIITVVEDLHDLPDLYREGGEEVINIKCKKKK